MSPTHRASRNQLRSVWDDPTRRTHALESFAAAREVSGHDLLAAARLIADPELRRHIETHAADNLRHAQMFRDRVAELDSAGPVVRGDAVREDSGMDGSKTPSGFAPSLCDELGEVAYVATVHVTEERARDSFELHAELTAQDPMTEAVFTSILDDQRRHIQVTGGILEEWREGGQESAVRESLRRARRGRLMGRWRQLGLHSGAGFSRFILRVMYWTVLLPFGLLSRPKRHREPSQTARHTDLKSQY
jgi:bacterioferritin (cytochrome b1)